MSALHARERTGRGQHIEVSLLQGVLSLTTQFWNWTDKGQFLLRKHSLREYIRPLSTSAPTGSGSTRRQWRV